MPDRWGLGKMTTQTGLARCCFPQMASISRYRKMRVTPRSASSGRNHNALSTGVVSEWLVFRTERRNECHFGEMATTRSGGFPETGLFAVTNPCATANKQRGRRASKRTTCGRVWRYVPSDPTLAILVSTHPTCADVPSLRRTCGSRG